MYICTYVRVYGTLCVHEKIKTLVTIGYVEKYVCMYMYVHVYASLCVHEKIECL